MHGSQKQYSTDFHYILSAGQKFLHLE